MRKLLSLTVILTLAISVCYAQAPTRKKAKSKTMQTIRLHIDGFSKSKSGAVWMAWPETVKQALEELDAVKKIEMLLDRDEFVVTFDAAKADAKRLIATIKNAGYTAQVISGNSNKSVAANAPAVLPSGFALLDRALEQAKTENKLIVLDFFAEWCAPCQRMEKTTFVDARVANLLARAVVVRIDTDQHADIAARMGVVGLPDIRFVKADGSIIRQLRGYVDVESFVKKLEQALRFMETK